VAKRLRSRHLPGRRSDAWLKIKRRQRLVCAVVGFLPEGKNDFKSLVLAADFDGELRSVGKVGSGIDERLRERLNQILWSRLRPTPFVPSKTRGKWVEPGIYALVSYLELTPGGELRAPVFEGLLEE